MNLLQVVFRANQKKKKRCEVNEVSNTNRA